MGMVLFDSFSNMGVNKNRPYCLTEKALAAMRRALDAGSIHEYEVDVMLDQLGL